MRERGVSRGNCASLLCPFHDRGLQTRSIRRLRNGSFSIVAEHIADADSGQAENHYFARRRVHIHDLALASSRVDAGLIITLRRVRLVTPARRRGALTLKKL